MTSEDVIALAPDAASARAGRELSNATKWQSLGLTVDVAWGECKGSGAHPYQARLDRANLTYTCTCPSRKFPCKHVLGLMLLVAANVVPAAATPDWVTHWLAARRAKDEPKATPAMVDVASQAAGADKATADAAKRAVAREARVALGLDELQRFLCDVVRLGFARVRSEPASFWDAKAARLVDAQAPGVARRVRALASIAASGTGWEQRLLDAFGSLYLLCEAYARIDDLAPRRRADVRRYIGWTQREDETIARADAIVADRWSVIGTRVEEDERLLVHRAWLVGARTNREALVLQFSQPGMAPTHAFALGTSFEAKLAYFDASVPQRVALAERAATASDADAPSGMSVDAIASAYATSVAADPWFETMPVRLAMHGLKRRNAERFAYDATLRGLPLHANAKVDELDAFCGSQPIVLAGEWNGRTLLPLGAWDDSRYISLV